MQGTVEFANLSLEERSQLPVADALVNSTCYAGIGWVCCARIGKPLEAEFIEKVFK